ncbi:MAG: hypothetical protein HN368_12680, partial [Spirochaetales bacterium]|nr:hypothetical protein [Spirochaetales bacterium]
PIGKKGSSKVTFSLVSSGYSASRTVSIGKVTLEMPDGSTQEILTGSFKIDINPDESVKVTLPVDFESIPDSGGYTGTMVFSFDGDTSFSPAASDVSYKVKGFVGNNIWIIPAGLVVLALLGLLGFFIPRLLAGGGRIAFTCVIDDGTVRKRQQKLKYSGKLYLVEGMMGLTLIENPGEEPAAEVTADGMGLHLKILDEEGYRPSEPIPTNVMDQEIVLIKKYGKKAKIRFLKP